jgi:cell division septation protein DedD
MSLLHQDDDLDPEPPERELTLSTGAILGIFAGLVLLCALFFAFGYMVRGRQTPAPILAAAPDTTTSSSTNFNSFKPAAGSPAASAQPPAHLEPPPIAADPPLEATHDVPATPHVPAEAAPLVHPTPAPRTPPATAAPTPLAPTAPPAAVPAGSFVVQVAAMSHADDANLLVGALKAKGYPAFARSEPQDKLLHIMVGPYTSRPAADAIKSRLSTDGYNNPIVK